MKLVIEVFDEYLDNFLKTKETTNSKISFVKILNGLNVSLTDIEVFIGSSYFFNITSEIFNIKNNLDMLDIQQAYSGFSKTELKKYLNILESFVSEIEKYRNTLMDAGFYYCPEIKLSGNVFKSKLPSSIYDLSELYIYDIKNKCLYIFFSNSGIINVFNAEICGYTQSAKYKLTVPYYTLNNIVSGGLYTPDFPLTTNVENLKLNRNMLILKTVINN